MFKVCGVKTYLEQRGHRAGTKTAFFVPGGVLEHASGNVFTGFCSQRGSTYTGVMQEHRKTALGKRTADGIFFAHKILVTTGFPAILSDK